jgi:hypothetical protein
MCPLVTFEPEKARAAFGRAPFSVRHTLSEHPLFSLDALAELADRLPQDAVEHNLGSVKAEELGGEVPRLDLTPGEIVRGIETNGSWIVLPFLDRTPPYDAIYTQILDDVASLVPGGRQKMSRFHSVVFLAAPNSTTPSHVDPELGFLLHLRGQKRLSIGSFEGPEVERAELERFHGGGHRNTKVPVGVTDYDLRAGDGVHVPPNVPHVVTNGPEVAVSLSVGFQTPENLRRNGVHKFNARVRRLGIEPKPLGASPSRDRAKASTLWAAASVAEKIRRK